MARRARRLFSEEDYLQEHPDVAAAVKDGWFASGYEHFCRHGLREGRFPGYRGFSHKRYFRKNPELNAMSFGDRSSFARIHFYAVGFPKRWPY